MEILIPLKQDELEERENRIERDLRHAWYETAYEYKAIKEKDLYKRLGAGKRGWSTWSDYCRERWNRDPSSIDNQIAVAMKMSEMPEISGISAEQLPATMSHATELSKLDTPKQRAEVWRRIMEKGIPITAKLVETEVELYKAELERDWITLDDWQLLNYDDKKNAMSLHPAGKKFNETNDNIEWARWSWNPITGCEHNCNYCYARDIANRFNPQRFVPSIYPNRLDAPSNTIPSTDFGGDKVFVCSMADLFGKWVPEEWINAVITQAHNNPQWTFLFLTKFPIRMAEFTYPDNVWLGTTVDKQYAVDRAEKAFRKIKASGFNGICWLSCEPMLERLTFTGLEMFDWVVIGGASKSTQTQEYLPPFDDIVHLYLQARKSGCRIYQKTNLLGDRVREYPEI